MEGGKIEGWGDRMGEDEHEYVSTKNKRERKGCSVGPRGLEVEWDIERKMDSEERGEGKRATFLVADPAPSRGYAQFPTVSVSLSASTTLWQKSFSEETRCRRKKCPRLSSFDRLFLLSLSYTDHTSQSPEREGEGRK